MSAAIERSPTSLNLERLAQIDLSAVRSKLVQQGWSPALAEAVEPEYRKMLALMASHPGHPLAPASAVDEFWHAHILHTKAYARDCSMSFGSFVHHQPATGPDRDDAALGECFRDTLALYRAEFGDPPVEIWGHGADCNDDSTDCTSNPNDCTGSAPGYSTEKD